MKREWELVEGEKKGRSSKEAKRSVFSTSYAHMLIYVQYMLTCSYMLVCSFLNILTWSYAIMLKHANHIYISSCFLQKEATGDSSTKLEGGECREGGNGRGWNAAEEVFLLFISFTCIGRKGRERNGAKEFVSSFCLVFHSLSMFFSLAEVIEVAIRAEYQVGIKWRNTAWIETKSWIVSNIAHCCPSERNSNVAKWTQSQCWLNSDKQDAKPPPLGRLNDREQAK